MSEQNAQTASFSQSRNDMYWTLYARPDGTIRWTGYDDSFWWDNVSKGDQFRKKVGPVSGRVYTLDPATNEVTVEGGQ